MDNKMTAIEFETGLAGLRERPMRIASFGGRTATDANQWESVARASGYDPETSEELEDSSLEELGKRGAKVDVLISNLPEVKEALAEASARIDALKRENENLLAMIGNAPDGTQEGDDWIPKGDSWHSERLAHVKAAEERDALWQEEVRRFFQDDEEAGELLKESPLMANALKQPATGLDEGVRIADTQAPDAVVVASGAALLEGPTNNLGTPAVEGSPKEVIAKGKGGKAAKPKLEQGG